MNNTDTAMVTFMNAVAPKVGPLNAVNLMKDAHLAAFKELFKKLGLSDKDIKDAIERNLQKTAQNIVSMPTPSPIQRLH